MKSLVIVIALIALTSPMMVAPASTRAQKEPETPSTPQVVSPARPDIPQPQLDNPLYCWRCGAPYPYAKKHYKDPMHRPTLAPGAEPRRPVGMAFQPVEDVLGQAEQLRLSDSQLSRLEDLVYATKTRLIDLTATLQKEVLWLQQMIRSGEDDISQIRRQLDVVANARVAIQSERLSSWFEAKKVLDDEQRKKLEEISHEFWPMME